MTDETRNETEKEESEEEKEEAEELLQDTEKLKEYLSLAKEKRNSLPMAKSLEKLDTMFELLDAYAEGNYTPTDQEAVTFLADGIWYLVRPEDLIPDRIPVIGMIDDRAVLGLVLKAAEEELRRFELSKTGKHKKKNP